MAKSVLQLMAELTCEKCFLRHENKCSRHNREVTDSTKACEDYDDPDTWVVDP